MSKTSKGGYYAVQKGRAVGVFNNWADCEAQTKGFQGAKYKKFASRFEAQKFAFPNAAAGSSQLATLAPSNAATAPTTEDKGKKRTFGAEVSNTAGWDIVYSDGACKGNGKAHPIAGVGVWWGPNDPRNLFERCPGDQTNNRAELIAILRVLETIPPETTTPLLIRTDSQYSMNCLGNWLHRWKQNGWKNGKGEPVKNAGIIRCITLNLDIRARLSHKVVLEYVKGHSGDIGNDGADLMANRGAMLPAATERDWDALEKALHQQFIQMRVGRNGEIPFEVKPHEEATDDSTVEGPNTKIRKITAQDIAAVSSAKPRTVQPYDSRPSATSNLMAITSTGSSTTNTIPSSTPDSIIATATPPMLPKPKTSQPISQPSSQKSRSATYDHIWNEQNRTPLQAIYLAPVMSVDAKDVNFDDYADCILDDADLANDLLDD